jgi:hypothetical protein
VNGAVVAYEVSPTPYLQRHPMTICIDKSQSATDHLVLALLYLLVWLCSHKRPTTVSLYLLNKRFSNTNVYGQKITHYLSL